MKTLIIIIMLTLGIYNMQAQEAETYAVSDMLTVSEELSQEVVLEIQLYPNPVSEQLNVRASGLSGRVKFQVFSVTGSLVADFEFHTEGQLEQLFDVSHLPIGPYKMKLSDGNRKIERMFVVL